MSSTCLAQSPITPGTGGAMAEQDITFASEAGFNLPTTIGDITAIIIKALLGLLGIIFIILMIYAGFLWMTAGGSEEQIKKAINLIRAAVIGLIIVIAAYSITNFVFDALSKSGVGGGGAGTAHTSN